MALSADFLDELKARTSIAEVVGRKVALRRAGREHSGLCPFHNEKTPSFTVSEEKGFFHCFGCGAHGSVIDFLMRTEGLAFPEAVERLASEAGMTMPRPDPGQKQAADQRNRLSAVMETATGWFQAQLQASVGAGARDYLARRGRTDKAIADFRIGYAPPGSATMKAAMLERGHSEADLLEVGLLAQSEDRNETYDRFRDRLMFPIADRQGTVIAFGGRALGEARAKYLNSPATPLFDKGRVLYNFARARPAALEHRSVIVAEGYMDVIALAEAGFDHVVAPLGTAITEHHLGLLWRMAAEPVLCLDGDNAGWRAGLRAAERALADLKPGRSLRFALLPEGVDPDDLVRQSGATAMQEVIDRALPLSELLWRQLGQGRALATPEDKAAWEADIGKLTARIGDETVRSHYQRHYRDRLWQALGAQRRGRTGRSGATQTGPGRRRRSDTAASTGPTVRAKNVAGQLAGNNRELRILRFVLAFPHLVEPHLEALAPLIFKDPQLDRLWDAVLEVAARRPGLDFDALRAQLIETGHAGALELVAGADAKKLELTRQANRESPAAGLRQTLERYFRDLDLGPELLNAESTLADNYTRETWARFQGVLREKTDAQDMDSAEPDRFGEEPKADGAV
jgi:DNA primase